jgi:hypothetical protein
MIHEYRGHIVTHAGNVRVKLTGVSGKHTDFAKEETTTEVGVLQRISGRDSRPQARYVLGKVLQGGSEFEQRRRRRPAGR